MGQYNETDRDNILLKSCYLPCLIIALRNSILGLFTTVKVAPLNNSRIITSCINTQIIVARICQPSLTIIMGINTLNI